MPCIAPIPAVKLEHGAVSLSWNDRERGRPLSLPCGSCIGCVARRARDWSIRCTFEDQQHAHSLWATLTYDEDHVPPTLDRLHLSAFVKRLRSRLDDIKIRTFACGEYGGDTGRPHYHIILFGLRDPAPIEKCWTAGTTHVVPLTPERISYTAQYTAKKIETRLDREERLDYRTGELYTYQPTFLQMSRGGRTGHGIGGAVRVHRESWRRTAIWNDNEVPAPRYYSDHWKKTATLGELAKLEQEIQQDQIEQTKRETRTKTEILTATRIILEHRQQQKKERHL